MMQHQMTIDDPAADEAQEANVKYAFMRPSLLAAALLAAGCGGGGDSEPAPLLTPPGVISGVLTDQTPYQITVPANWNGIVLNDLDSVTNLAASTSQEFIKQGYAFTGTGRPPDRETNHDPKRELDDQAKVLDIFRANFGKPKLTIQVGCSGGGFVALAMSEFYPDKVDGVVAFNARGTGGLAVSNMWLDLPFALKALLAPTSDLQVAPITIEARPAAQAAWTAALQAAAQTPEGRARIALAVAVSQWPTWSSGAKPDPTDLPALQKALVASATNGMNSVIGRRALYDNPAGLATWNTGVNYRQFYETGGDPAQKQIVNSLYAAAGLTEAAVTADLERINAAPRIAGTAAGVNYWRVPGRMLSGDVKVPMLQIHGIGDPLLPPVLTRGYGTAVTKQGRTSLYRQAFVNSAGHCTQNTAETIAAVRTMVRRLQTGEWGDTTSTAKLNAAATEVGATRYLDYQLLPQFNRAIFPDSVFPFSL